MKLLSALLVSAACLLPLTVSTAPAMAAAHGAKHATASHHKGHGKAHKGKGHKHAHARSHHKKH